MARGCLRQIFFILLVGLLMGSIFRLYGKVVSDRWFLYPDLSLLGGVAFLAIAVLLPFSLIGAASGAQEVAQVTRARMILSNAPIPVAEPPGASCAIVASLPAVVVLALFGLLLVTNGITLWLFGINIANWLFAISLTFQ